MTSNPMACQAGQLKSTLSLLTSATCQPWDCVPPLSRLVSHVPCCSPFFHGWPLQDLTGSGESGWGSCTSLFHSLYGVRQVPGSQVGEAVTPSSMTILLRAREISVSQAGKVVTPLFHSWSPQCQTGLGIVCPFFQDFPLQGWIDPRELGWRSCDPSSMDGLLRDRQASGSQIGEITFPSSTTGLHRVRHAWEARPRKMHALLLWLPTWVSDSHWGARLGMLHPLLL